jgi:RHS repeat-associated protein
MQTSSEKKRKSSGVDSVTTTYTCDWSSQILTESRSGYSASYTYDANGNRATRTVNGSTETYSYDSGDKLTAITGGSDPGTFSYDLAGRMTQMARSSSGTKDFTYDFEGRITQITKAGMTTNTFTYNGLDTRVGKVDSLGSATYRRDGVGVTEDVLSDGTRSYTPGVSQRQGSASKFVLDDYLGTTGRLLDANQNVTDTFTYDAFGVQTARTGTTVRPFGYAGSHGYQEDGDTGLKLLGHRYYDPTIGRFLTRDPIQDGRNWYAYCDNNPLSRTDATGLSYHDPMHVSVDPQFKGKVWVVGEVSSTSGQIVVELKPGESSPAGMDVDYVIIVFPDGRTERWFLMGLGYLSLWDEAEYATIGAGGEVTAPGVIVPIFAGDLFDKEIQKAKKRKVPNGVRPVKGPAKGNPPSSYLWDDFTHWNPFDWIPNDYNPGSWGIRF